MKIKAKIFFVTVIISIVIIYPCLSQNRIIKYIYDDQNISRPIAIVFTDSITAESDTFDIIKNNPFNDLKYNVIYTDFWGWKSYSFTKEEYNILIPLKQRINYLPESEDILNETDYLIGGTTLSSGFDNEVSNVVLAYSFMAMNSANDLYIGATGYFFIIDRHGNVIKKSAPLGVDVNEIVISEDNNYIGFHYGSAMNNRYINSGIKIYDVINDSLIIDYPINDPIVSSFVGSKLIFNAPDPIIEGKPRLHSMYYIDAEKRNIGKYTFTVDEWRIKGNIQKDTKGLYFFNKKGASTKILFEQDFEKIDIK